jgi:hypothetical protein
MIQRNGGGNKKNHASVEGKNSAQTHLEPARADKTLVSLAVAMPLIAI